MRCFSIFLLVILSFCKLSKSQEVTSQRYIDIFGEEYKFEIDKEFYYQTECNLVKIDSTLKSDEEELISYYIKKIRSPLHYGDKSVVPVSFIINPLGKIEQNSILEDVMKSCKEDEWKIKIDTNFIFNYHLGGYKEYIVEIADICSCLCQKDLIDKSNPTSFIDWSDSVEGDFSFTKKWDYPEGVYLNQFGQLSCDGLCPSEIEKMKDSNGKIIGDSLTSFYRYIDTTHQFYSLQSSTNGYEFGETNFMYFTKLLNDTIYGVSDFNTATHSTLHIKFTSHYCMAWIEYNSVRPVPVERFLLLQGHFIYDETLFDKGIIKANFDFKFKNTLETENELFWKGKIYSEIEN